MAENDRNKFFLKKSYEIAYALFRLAGSLSSSSFREILEKEGLELIAAGVSGDLIAANKILNITDYLLRFGADVGVLNRSNVETISKEISGLNSAIAGFSKPAIPEEISLDNVFSKISYPMEENIAIPVKFGKDIKHPNRISCEDSSQDKCGMAISMSGELTSAIQNNNGTGIVKSAMRQAAILERIRQNSNCRLKDIQEFLPEVSERTIRYDIQDLIGEGIIERFGNGGPATYYQVRSA